jgi:quercetin dioxygenase-like cupin family protein
MSTPHVSQAIDLERLEWLGGGIVSVLLDAEKTDGAVTVLRSSAADGAASPVHVHADDDEIVVLLQGSGVFWAGENRYELTDGGVAFLPRGVPHAYLLTSDTVDMLGVCLPSGVEHFFRAAGWDLSDPKPEGWAITPAGMAAAAAATGQTILGPPLAAEDMIPAACLDRGQQSS